MVCAGFDTNSRPAARVHQKLGRSTDGSGPGGPSVHLKFLHCNKIGSDSIVLYHTTDYIRYTEYRSRILDVHCQSRTDVVNRKINLSNS